MRAGLRAAFAVGSVALAGCYSGGEFDVQVPQSQADKYKYCLANSRGICEADPAQQTMTAGAFMRSQAMSALPASRPALDTKVAPNVVDAFSTRSALSVPGATASLAQPGAAAPQYRILNPANIQALVQSINRMSDAEKTGAALMRDEAQKFLDHPVQQQMNALYNRLAESRGNVKADAMPVSAGQTVPQKLPPIEIKRSEVEDYIHSAMRISLGNGWSYQRAQAMINLAAEPNNPQRPKDATTALFLEAYFRAYFRNGKFFEGKTEFADFYTRYPDLGKEPYKGQIDPILAKLTGVATFGKVASAGFVTRTGSSLQIPPLEITLDPTKDRVLSVSKLDALAVGTDLIRVGLEAIFDAHDLLPAVSNATGVTLDVGRPLDVLGLESMTDAKYSKKISTDHFASSTQYANTSDAAASTLAGELIRGLNVVALNNEALAKVIESLAGTAGRKVTEKVTYCWYACVATDTQEQSALALPRHPEAMQTVRVRFKND